jgi:hypothetical protein
MWRRPCSESSITNPTPSCVCFPLLTIRPLCSWNFRAMGHVVWKWHKSELLTYLLDLKAPNVLVFGPSSLSSGGPLLYVLLIPSFLNHFTPEFFTSSSSPLACPILQTPYHAGYTCSWGECGARTVSEAQEMCRLAAARWLAPMGKDDFSPHSLSSTKSALSCCHTRLRWPLGGLIQ